jgi:ATP sulfurylase
MSNCCVLGESLPLTCTWIALGKYSANVHRLSLRTLHDSVLHPICRAFSPLEGFMSEQQYISVVQNMRLPVRSSHACLYI